MHECESGKCDMGHHGRYGHGGSHEEMEGCMCGCSSDCSCGCGCCGHGEGGKAKEFLFLAKSAHFELLKHKMKTVMEAKIGKKMDKVAELVVDTALVYMKDKMAEKQTFGDFEDKLMDIFKGS